MHLNLYVMKNKLGLAVTIIPPLIQAWELEPEKRPTFAASRDSLDLFRTQNPQWRRRKTFPRISKKTWEESVFLFKQWELKVTQSTGEESRTVTYTIVTERLLKHKTRKVKSSLDRDTKVWWWDYFFKSKWNCMINPVLPQTLLFPECASLLLKNLEPPAQKCLWSDITWSHLPLKELKTQRLWLDSYEDSVAKFFLGGAIIHNVSREASPNQLPRTPPYPCQPKLEPLHRGSNEMSNENFSNPSFCTLVPKLWDRFW